MLPSHSYSFGYPTQQRSPDFLSVYGGAEEATLALAPQRLPHTVSAPEFPGPILAAEQSQACTTSCNDDVLRTLRLAALNSLLCAIPPTADYHAQNSASVCCPPQSGYIGDLRPEPLGFNTVLLAVPTTPPSALTNLTPDGRSSLAYHMQQQPSAARVPSGLHSMSTRHLSNAAWHPSNLPQRNNNYVAQFPQSDSQGTGVFLPKPQRPSQSKTRAAKSSAVRQCPSTLSHADSDLSCHSSTTDCIMLLTEACSQGAPTISLPAEWMY